MLQVACSRCERYGRLSVAKLIARYGGGAKLPDLREILAGVSPRVGAASIYERCGISSLAGNMAGAVAGARGAMNGLPALPAAIPVLAVALGRKRAILPR